MTTRPAYKSVPEKPLALYRDLKPPAEGYGVEVTNLSGSILLIVVSAVLGTLSLVASFGLLSLGADGRISFYLLVSVAILFFAGAGVVGILMIKPLQLQKIELQQRASARTKYEKEQLLPYLEARYGAKDVIHSEKLLNGQASAAVVAGVATSIIMVESADGQKTLELGFYDESIKVADDKAKYGDDGGSAIFLFPYSVDDHASSGDGSVHANSDGSGSFGSDSGGGDGGGGDGGGGGD